MGILSENYTLKDPQINQERLEMSPLDHLTHGIPLDASVMLVMKSFDQKNLGRV